MTPTCRHRWPTASPGQIYIHWLKAHPAVEVQSQAPRVRLGIDHVPFCTQQPRVRLGQADNVRLCFQCACESRGPLRPQGGPLNTPVDQTNRHRVLNSTRPAADGSIACHANRAKLSCSVRSSCPADPEHCRPTLTAGAPGGLPAVLHRDRLGVLYLPVFLALQTVTCHSAALSDWGVHTGRRTRRLMSCTDNSTYHIELTGFALSMLCQVGAVLPFEDRLFSRVLQTFPQECQCHAPG